MLVHVPLLGAMLVAALTFLAREYYPDAPVTAIGLLLVLSLLWHAFRGAMPIEFVRYRYRNGELAFDIARGERQEVAFNAFTLELSRRAENKGQVAEIDPPPSKPSQ